MLLSSRDEDLRAKTAIAAVTGISQFIQVLLRKKLERHTNIYIIGAGGGHSSLLILIINWHGIRKKYCSRITIMPSHMWAVLRFSNSIPATACTGSKNSCFSSALDGYFQSPPFYPRGDPAYQSDSGPQYVKITVTQRLSCMFTPEPSKENSSN